MTIILKADKGSLLTPVEADNNIKELRDGTGAVTPALSGLTGTKIGDYATAEYGWHDLIGNIHVDEDDANAPKMALYRGLRVKARQFLPTTTEGLVDFHMPHDYVLGTPIHIHVHWSHTGVFVTGGSVTWGFELMYSKGHNQGAFAAPINIAIISPANVVQYQQMTDETIASSVGGNATTLDTNLLEPDGVIQGAVYLDSNDLTVSGGGIPDPFVHFVDIHYQSTGAATLNRLPNFYGA